MTFVTFKEYQEAKNEIIGGVEYKEETRFPNQWGMMSKQYGTEKNGTFYEVTDPNTGIVEFWSDKDSKSRYYNTQPEAATEPEEAATSWTVFLTTSQRAAFSIAHGYACDWNAKVNGVLKVKCGSADGNDLIPAQYYGKGYYYTAAEVVNADCSNEKRHEIIVC